MNQTEIQSILKQAYNRSNWQSLLIDVFPKAQFFNIPKQLPSTNELVEKLYQLGVIELNDYKNIGIFEIQVSPNAIISKNRVALRNVIVPFIDQDKINGALVIYFVKKELDYRFSFIARTSEFDDDGNIKKLETHPKRFTYVLGPNQSCRTAAERIFRIREGKGVFIELKDVTNAFSVVNLTKEFFDLYSKHYKAFVQNIVESDYLKTIFNINSKSFEGIEDEKLRTIREFVKLLLGRVVFIYFLQKKGWMGCSANTTAWKGGDAEFLKNFFNNFNNKKNFYSKGLSVLFFATLNTQRPNDIFSLTNTRVPYLNGGLFENHFERSNKLDFPVELFIDLFNFFDCYNFTIDESAPNDEEVGIDPEMLGHIFENLLEDNKDKGSYYTPKDIVHYMCQQSLLRYLKNKLLIPGNNEDENEKALEYFVIQKNRGEDKDRNNFIRINAKKISELIDNIKICDPAIGSGAFPMGLLKELLDLKLALNWELDTTDTKKKIIENSIYGVDVDKGAVDIARLRFWLSLIVDEDEPAPLPNLDYKIMQGDSLRESFKGIDFQFDYKRLLDTLSIEKDANLFGEVHEPQYTLDELLISQAKAGKFNIVEKEKEIFHNYDPEKKKQIRTEIANVERDFIKIKIDLEKSHHRKNLTILKAQLKVQTHQSKIKSLERQIKTIEDRIKYLGEVEQEALNIDKDDKPYFLWHLYFMDVFKEGGFDIIIANPPYIRADSKNTEHKQFRKELELSKMYETLYEKWDVFIPFIERGLKFLKDEGVLVYITSNSLCTSKYAERLIEFIQEKYCTFILDYFEKMEVFEGVGVIPVISGYVMGCKSNIIVRKQIHKRSFRNIIERKIINLDEFRKGGKNSFRREYEPIVLNIEQELLGNICYISKGMVIHSEESKYGNEFAKDDLISDKYDEIHSKKYLEAKWIKRYEVESHKYLEWNTERVPNKLSRPTFKELYDRPKLLRGATVGGIFDESFFLCNHSIIVFVRFIDLQGIDNRSISNSLSKFNQEKRYVLEHISTNYAYKYLLAILNSKYAYYFLNNIRRHRLENYFYPDDFRKLPIPITSETNQEILSILVDYISYLKLRGDETKEMNLMISYIDQIIDGCVYELFFSNEFKKRNWSLLKNLTELKRIDDIEHSWTKLTYVTDFFDLVYNKEHPVRNIIFYLDSIEEIKKIENQYANYRNRN